MASEARSRSLSAAERAPWHAARSSRDTPGFRFSSGLIAAARLASTVCFVNLCDGSGRGG